MNQKEFPVAGGIKKAISDSVYQLPDPYEGRGVKQRRLQEVLGKDKDKDLMTKLKEGGGAPAFFKIEQRRLDELSKENVG